MIIVKCVALRYINFDTTVLEGISASCHIILYDHFIKTKWQVLKPMLTVSEWILYADEGADDTQ